MTDDGVCKVCRDQTNSANHTKENHAFNTLLYEWKTYKKALVKNRDGITISQCIVTDEITDDEHSYNERKGKLCVRVTPQKLSNLSRTVRIKFVITNNRKSESVHFVKAQLLYPMGPFSLDDDRKCIEEEKYFEIHPKKEFAIYVIYSPSKVTIGDHKNQLVIKFQTKKKPVEQINFFRDLQVTVSDHLKAVDDSKETPFKNEQWEHIIEIIPAIGQRPTHDQYPIPDQYYNILLAGLKCKEDFTEVDRDTLKHIKSILCSNYIPRTKWMPRLTKSNYQDFFHTLLWMDEAYAAHHIRQYNMSNVTMSIVMKGVLELEVLGLAEKRPSLVAGDIVRIRQHADHTGYEGVVKTINSTTIWIHAIDENILDLVEYEPETEFDVAFQLGRLPSERKLKGVVDCVRKGLLNTLFPPKGAMKISKSNYRPEQITFYNKLVEKNVEQRTAVMNILNETAFPYPYIVFGPPGTGKTVTIVEAILQLKRMNPKARILVCAPSNAACDMLTIKLGNCQKDEMIRLHSATRNWSDVPEVVKRYSKHDGRQFERIHGAELVKYRIVVTTLVLIGKYSGQYVPDYVFIDEAAQACEPEAAIAISMLVKPKLILAGDHLQLGPCGWRVALRLGLGLSLLERLIKYNELYQNFDPRYISMLRLNYRAHPLVLHVPNELFYESKLQAINMQALHDPLAQLCVYNLTKPGRLSKQNFGAKQVGFPVEFCSVIAMERRQGKSPSFFNPAEIEMVLNYVDALMKKSSIPIGETDIGIISPYVRQVHRIKEDLRKVGYEQIEVGTTEAFQGREKRVMIISTVRGRHNLLLYDRKYDLGFVNSEKRMNVALTRAMSKLIIIGNPTVLNSNNEACKNWRYLIEFCESKNSSFGMSYQRRDEILRQKITDGITGGTSKSRNKKRQK